MISYDGQSPTCYCCNEIGHQQSECPRKKRLGNLIVGRESTWADIVSKVNQEPNQHMQMRQENTTQGNRAESPIRKGEQPLETEQYLHPQDKQFLLLWMMTHC